jgi:hypothetical protein
VFPIYDRAKIEFRAEATNAINHPNWSNPGTNINSPSSFGIITSAGAMRQLQVGARATF